MCHKTHALFVTISIVLSFTACGKTNSGSDTQKPIPGNGTGVVTLYAGDDFSSLRGPARELQLEDPDDAYLTGAYRHLRPASLVLRDAQRISSAGLRVIRGSEALTRLDLSWCTGLGDDAISILGTCPNLTELRMAGCAQISFDAWPELAGASQLRKVNLSGSTLDDKGLHALSRLHLESVTLWACKGVSYAGIKEFLAVCETVNRLDLTSCFQLSDTDVTALKTEFGEVAIVGPKE